MSFQPAGGMARVFDVHVLANIPCYFEIRARIRPGASEVS